MMHNRQSKMLLLTGNYGDGHKQAAIAISEAAEIHEPGMQTVVTDFMEWSHPKLNAISRYLYIQGIKKFPSVYGYLFQKTRSPGSFSDALKKIKLFGLERVMDLIKRENPTVIVSTFPVAAAAMSVLKLEGLIDIPTVTVITDHTDHSYWLHPYTDRYIVGSHGVAEALTAAGVPASAISVTGIPVRHKFCMNYNRTRLLQKYMLDPSYRTVLVMGGGFGMIGKEWTRILNSERFADTLQFIVVCGHNRKLYQQLTEDLQTTKQRVLVTGYTEQIHELMAASDLIVTKPGGLTTAEAVAMGLPMILYKPLPGQEQDNAAFLLQAGVALQVEEADLFNVITRLTAHPQELESMKRQAGQIAAKSAAKDALQAIDTIQKNARRSQAVRA